MTAKATGRGALRMRERQDHALHLRREGCSYQEIADRTGYANPQTARGAVVAALNRQPSDDARTLRALEDARLDAMAIVAWEVMHGTHLMVQQGRLIEGIVDVGPNLAAIDRLLRISEARRRLHGLDAPIRARVEVITQDEVDAEIKRLEAELAGRSVPGEPAAAETTSGAGATPEG